MTKQTKERYLKAIKGKTINFSDIKAIKKALNRLRFGSENAEKENRQNVLNEVLRSIEGKEYRITKEHSKQGIEYLNRYCFKSNGEPRKQAHASFSLDQIAIIQNFAKFRFVGFTCLNNGYGMFWYEPIWRLYSKKGNSFDYYCGHWSKPVVK